MAKMKKEGAIEIKPSTEEREVTLYISDFYSKTGNVAVAGPLNVRNQGRTCPKNTDIIKWSIKTTKETNNNYEYLVEQFLLHGYRGLGTSPLKLVDMVDALKAGPFITNYIFTFYAKNVKMINFCKKVVKIIEAVYDDVLLEAHLRKFRGEYYLLTGGNSRICILLDETDDRYYLRNEKTVPLRAVVQDLSICDSAIAPALRKRLSADEEDATVMQNAIALTIMAMIAEDNRVSKETMSGSAQEIAVANLYSMCFEANLYDLEEATFTQIYRAYSNFFEYCGYEKNDKVLNCVIGQDAARFLNGNGAMKNAQRSFIKGCLEAIFQCGFKGEFSFIEKNAIVVKDREGLNAVYQHIVDVHTNALIAKQPMNGDCLKKPIKQILKAEFNDPDTIITAEQMILIIDRAAEMYFESNTQKKKWEMMAERESKAKKIIAKSMKDLENYDRKDLVKMLRSLNSLYNEVTL